MLISLYLENYVLFDKQNLNFKEGFISVTGDTGAGKSLVIDALGYLTGNRIYENINKDKNKSTYIEASFLFKNPKTFEILKENNFLEEDVYVISREISPDGKSVSKINYRTTTLTFIKSIFENELDIHSQRDNQYLLNKKTHLNLLDSYSNNDKLLLEVSKAYDNFKDLENKIKHLKSTIYNEEEIEYLKTLILEIKNADINESEYDQLTSRLDEINNFENIYKSLNESNQILITNKGLLELFYDLNSLINRLSEFSEYSNLVERLEVNYHDLVDISDEISSSLLDLEYDEYEVNQIEERLFTINHLYKKYGGSYYSMIDRLDEMEEKVLQFENKEENLLNLEKQLTIKKEEYLNKAVNLSKKRQLNINNLEKAVLNHLKDLQLDNANFKVLLNQKDFSKNGIDDVEFLVAMNKGSELSPLIRVASGGEISRLMLGLKVIFTKLYGVSTIIFDEIDVGVSGSVATSIGLKMYELSKFSQVVSVTHLAQVAACSDFHYHVNKDVNNNLSSTEVRLLNQKESLEQLALISSGIISENTLKAAKELYDKSKKKIADING